MVAYSSFKKVLNNSASKKLPLYSVFVRKYKFKQVLVFDHDIPNIVSKVFHTIS